MQFLLVGRVSSYLVSIFVDHFVLPLWGSSGAGFSSLIGLPAPGLGDRCVPLTNGVRGLCSSRGDRSGDVAWCWFWCGRVCFEVEVCFVPAALEVVEES